MSDPRQITAERVFELFRHLTPEGQARFDQLLQQDPDNPRALTPVRWWDYATAAAALGVSTSTVSRNRSEPRLITNGAQGKGKRVRRDSVALQLLERAKPGARDRYTRKVEAELAPELDELAGEAFSALAPERQKELIEREEARLERREAERERTAAEFDARWGGGPS